MAATAADPRAKPPAAPSHHLKTWAPPEPRCHRMPSFPVVSSSAGGGGGAHRDRSRSSSHRRGGTDAAAAVEEYDESYDGGLEDLRAKLMGHLRDAFDRLRLPSPAPPAPPPAKLLSPPTEPEPQAPQPQPQQDAAARPWNLRDRKRRLSAKRGTLAAATPWAAATAAERGGERARFSVALTAEEIEEDIYALTGARSRRRPRKRPRVVQRQFDSLFPGLWLSEITADDYKVPDN